MTPPMHLLWRSATCTRAGSGTRGIPTRDLRRADSRYDTQVLGRIACAEVRPDAPDVELRRTPDLDARTRVPEMIAFLSGRVLHKQPNRVIVDVGGVGYDVHVPLSTFYEVGDEGAETRYAYSRTSARTRFSSTDFSPTSSGRSSND